MARFFHLIAVLALSAAGVNAMGAPALMLQPVATERSPGCHQHRSSPKAPLPSNSQCCLIGHDTAVLQAVHRSDLGVQVHQPEAVREYVLRTTRITELGRNFSSERPPGISPLRI